jgi:hypothetical protein
MNKVLVRFQKKVYNRENKMDFRAYKWCPCIRSRISRNNIVPVAITLLLSLLESLLTSSGMRATNVMAHQIRKRSTAHGQAFTLLPWDVALGRYVSEFRVGVAHSS